MDEIYFEKYGLDGQIELLNLIEEFSDMGSIYLKREWEVVKKEAKTGAFKKSITSNYTFFIDLYNRDIKIVIFSLNRQTMCILV
ncbi:hypothetical protein [Oceanobacillus kimchii]|uniref:hypothetical protein n=1 Tax=Oceanobacillus kimchii TaxID=746691 RepID=UPI00232F22DC|nr:hypothetical protein [Oceanobacillus kimchii]